MRPKIYWLLLLLLMKWTTSSAQKNHEEIFHIKFSLGVENVYCKANSIGLDYLTANRRVISLEKQTTHLFPNAPTYSLGIGAEIGVASYQSLDFSMDIFANESLIGFKFLTGWGMKLPLYFDEDENWFAKPGFDFGYGLSSFVLGTVNASSSQPLLINQTTMVRTTTVSLNDGFLFLTPSIALGAVYSDFFQMRLKLGYQFILASHQYINFSSTNPSTSSRSRSNVRSAMIDMNDGQFYTDQNLTTDSPFDYGSWNLKLEFVFF